MNRAVDLIRESKVFFIATTEGDQPRVRPFGVVADIHDKVYLATDNTKKCFRQMLENPKVEMAGMLPDGRWIRVTGVLVHDPSREAKVEFLRQSEYMANIYTVDDGIFEVLYFSSGVLEVVGHGESEFIEL
ncbi:pyridoxamine 5'-phosphate oxidase family protein [Bacteroidales bacterium OttesenSCG-928-J19]|nr:pyridoxamine 5'-phosphate oxidase family protein [Bacteroidales bacterium OttesenSCG-928-J19]